MGRRNRYVLRARAAAERSEQRAERRAGGARRAGALLEAEAGGGDLGLWFQSGVVPGGDGALASAFEAGDAGADAGGWDDNYGGEGPVHRCWRERRLSASGCRGSTEALQRPVDSDVHFIALLCSLHDHNLSVAGGGSLIPDRAPNSWQGHHSRRRRPFSQVGTGMTMAERRPTTMAHCRTQRRTTAPVPTWPRWRPRAQRCPRGPMQVHLGFL